MYAGRYKLQFLQKLVMQIQWPTEKTKCDMDFMSRDWYRLDCYSSVKEVMSLSFVKTECDSVLHSMVANATMNNSLGF
jgi:hypothetical protein